MLMRAPKAVSHCPLIEHEGGLYGLQMHRENRLCCNELSGKGLRQASILQAN